LITRATANHTTATPSVQLVLSKPAVGPAQRFDSYRSRPLDRHRGRSRFRRGCERSCQTTSGPIRRHRCIAPRARSPRSPLVAGCPPFSGGFAYGNRPKRHGHSSPRLRNQPRRAATAWPWHPDSRTQLHKPPPETEQGFGFLGPSRPQSLCSSDGARRTRTADLLGAIQALSQLSYSPARGQV
jgi:hypothetical protein